MDRGALRDDQWVGILPLIPGGSAGKRGPRTDNRRFINALLWMARSGARWKDLPPDFGAFQTVKRRYYRWLEHALIDAILDVSAKPVIPPRRHRKYQYAYDKALYKERNLIERSFNKIKQFRRVATRYDKLLNNFMGFVKIAAIASMLRSIVSTA